MQRTLLLDLDGTLVDSVPDIAAALNRLLISRGLDPFATPAVAAMVGDGSPVLLARAFAARGSAPDAAALGDFLADYTRNVAALTRPFPGVAAGLAALAADGWRLAVCTNKPEAPARALLAELGLISHFAAVGGGDSYPTRKPDPGHILATLAAAGGDPTRAVMAGDHHNDVAAAHGAGMPCIFAAWGYGPRSQGADAAAIAEDFAGLVSLAGRLCP